jgi:hypothetical protein
VEKKYASWFKSTRSSAGDNCVEASFADNGDVGVRDSKDPTGPILEFTGSEWTAFIAGVREGEFDREGA